MVKRNNRKTLKLVVGISVTAFALLLAILLLNAYTDIERPKESYAMNVCFWDHGELVSLRNASKDFDDVLLCTAQKVNLQAKCVFFEDRVDARLSTLILVVLISLVSALTTTQFLHYGDLVNTKITHEFRKFPLVFVGFLVRSFINIIPAVGVGTALFFLLWVIEGEANVVSKGVRI
jgi:hypothetical protein